MEISELHDLIGKELADKLLDVEREVLLAWLAQASAEERLVYDEIKLFWQCPRLADNAADTARAFDRLLARIDESEMAPTLAEPLPTTAGEARVLLLPRPWWRRTWAAAASVALLATASVFSYQRYQAHFALTAAPSNYEERTNPRGTKSKVLLADGTAVWLNADSHLWFPAAFAGTHREVYLDGEAFFDVKRNEHMPFIIHLGANQVRVLGTSFNVKAYRDDEAVETAVVTGRVAFIRAASPAATAERDTIYVVPDEKVVYSKTSHELRIEQVNSRDYAAWNQRSLIFQATPLGEVAKTLARQFNVTVRFEDEKLRNCRLTGRFRDQSLREVLRLVEMTGAFSFALTDNTLTVKGAGCEAEETSAMTI